MLEKIEGVNTKIDNPETLDKLGTQHTRQRKTNTKTQHHTEN